MNVNYFGVEHCTFGEYEGHPVIFAPPYAAPSVLMQHAFVQLPDGRWCHYLSDAETNFIINTPEGLDATFSVMQETVPQTGGQAVLILNILSVVLTVAALVLLIGFTKLNGLYWCLLPAIVLNIIVRVKYPANQAGKVISIVLAVICVILAVIAVLIVIACAMACNECMDQCASCHLD